jgi:hypothetical protein
MTFESFDERYPGYSIRGADGKEREILTSGKCYRVIKQFSDFDKRVHLPGEQWLFKGYSYWPHDDATTFFVSVEGGRESEIRFSEDPIVRHLDTYLAPVTSETS